MIKTSEINQLSDIIKYVLGEKIFWYTASKKACSDIRIALSGQELNCTKAVITKCIMDMLLWKLCNKKVTREYSSRIHFQRTCYKPYELGLSIK
jgi:hypothetical protein